VIKGLLNTWDIIRHKVEMFEDRLYTTRSLKRLLACIEIEPFFLDPPSVIGNQADLVEAISEAIRQRHSLSHRVVHGLLHEHPANTIWVTVERALKELVSSRIDCGQQMFSILNINEIQSSKSSGFFKSIKEFGAHVAKYDPCSTAADFQKATSHSFPVGGRFTIVYRTWTGRYRWNNDDGSHHAALAHLYALTFDDDFQFKADLFQQIMDRNAGNTLRETIRGFLLPIGGMPARHENQLSNYEVPFQEFTLRIHGQEREVLLIYPGTQSRPACCRCSAEPIE
jgi:hypothetical protein